MITIICVCFGLFCVSSAAKAHADTINFRVAGFSRYPEWLQDWLYSKGPSATLKSIDGWHVCQSVMFLFMSVAFVLGAYYAGAHGIHPALAFLALWALRLLAQGLVFETLYPIR